MRLHGLLLGKVVLFPRECRFLGYLPRSLRIFKIVLPMIAGVLSDGLVLGAFGTCWKSYGHNEASIDHEQNGLPQPFEHGLQKITLHRPGRHQLATPWEGRKEGRPYPAGIRQFATRRAHQHAPCGRAAISRARISFFDGKKGDLRQANDILGTSAPVSPQCSIKQPNISPTGSIFFAILL
jgi:hypothetical protein